MAAENHEFKLLCQLKVGKLANISLELLGYQSIID